MKPRLGFLGVGWIGRHRMRAVARTGMADIVAIADASHEAARAAASDLDTPASFATSLPELLEHDLDGVVIATPSALHAEQSVTALERGVAVFCQKPLARTAAETRSVVGAARRANRLLGVDLSYRFTSGMQRIRELIGSGELGDVYAVDVTFHNAYGPDKPWFYDSRLSGGGCVMDLGVHLVDLALWTLGFPDVQKVDARLFAGGRPVGRSRRHECVEDYASARLDLSNGAAVQLTCSWNASAGCDAVIAASFFGARGGAALRNVNGSFHDFVAEAFRGTSRRTLSEPPDEWGGRAAVDWLARLAAGERTDPDADRLVSVAQTLDRIYER